jgi:hypothetical protein
MGLVVLEDVMNTETWLILSMTTYDLVSEWSPSSNEERNTPEVHQKRLTPNCWHKCNHTMISSAIVRSPVP